MYMFKYICKRLGLVLMTFTIIFVMCFVLIKLKPIDMNTVGIGQDADKLRRLLEARGYLKPIPEQLFLYLKRIVLDLDFGVGVYIPQYSGQPVWGVFIEKLPPTILINVYSSLLAVPVGIVLGIFAALKKNKWQDHFISTAVMVVISVPSFVYASLLLFILCFKLPVDLQLPKSMLSLPDIVSLFPEKGLQYIPLTFNWDLYFNWPMIKSMLPAVFAMSFGSIAGYARFTRAELTEVLTSEFMLLARTKGLTKSQATVRHALRNSMVPIFPSIVGEFISVLSGSLIIERIFSIPGVGALYLSAINATPVPDYDFFMMLSAFYTLIGLVAGLVIDLSYGVIDPRIRMGAR
ncbi:MAG: ABC transporter permease [Clostridia bacterium]|nr:ABC transporter permease [Clostridia bacterium]MBO7246426.1 ABC transporter permease [Clostridia bacterium]MBO7737507.1 ABC transporter permease [Clostridia bacterium]MBR6506655.1 ABC transporter permease [Clostridia bacterium]